MSEATAGEEAGGRRLGALDRLLLWFGALGGAAAWALQLAAGYGLEEAGCSAGSGGGPLLGVGVEPLIVALTLVCGATAAAAGAASWRSRLAAARGELEDTRGRVAFMSLAGVLSSPLFLALIVLGGVQLAALDACAR